MDRKAFKNLTSTHYMLFLLYVFSTAFVLTSAIIVRKTGIRRGVLRDITDIVIRKLVLASPVNCYVH
tara:strand:- start:54074 stop:54274 length:201 start_codon:yes stop_codon:yes gene_type:complete